MLLGLVTAVAIALSGGVCIWTDAFESFMWLWLMPVTFLLTLAVQGGLIFLTLWIMAARVDMSVLPERDSKLYRFAIDQVAGALIPVLGVKVKKKGFKQLPKKGRFLLVCNHISDLDPVFLLACFRKSGLAFVSKRENDEKFIVGPLMRKILCQPINRENDREALKTVLNCIRLIEEDKASIGVFPEGYVSLDCLLRHFKGGVFKIAKRAKVPVVVCTLQGTRTVFPSAAKLRPSQVQVHLVGVIDPQTVAESTAVELAEKAHAMMAEDLGEALVYSGPPEDAWKGTGLELLMQQKEKS